MLRRYPGLSLPVRTKPATIQRGSHDFAFVLEVELQRQLHDPRVARADDLSEAARLSRQSYPVEVGVVEDVEGLPPGIACSCPRESLCS